MKRFLPLFICTLCFSDNIDKLYKEAQNLENQGNYKEAMILYKKAANLNITKEDKYILDLLEFVNQWLVSHILEKDKLIAQG